MESPSNFKQSLYAQLNSVDEEFWDRSVGSIFEKEEDDASIEVRCWSRLPLIGYGWDEEAVVRQDQTTGTDGEGIVGLEYANDRGCDENILVTQTDARLPSNADYSPTKLAAPRQGTEVSLADVLNAPDHLNVIDLDFGKLERFIRATHRCLRVLYNNPCNLGNRLEITKDSFRIFSRTCHICPELQQFLIDFKWEDRETEVGPPRIRFHLAPHLRRGDHVEWGFECAYIVRFVEFTNRPSRYPWSLRQYVVSHKYIAGSHGPYSTWALFGSSQRAEKCISRYTSGVKHPIQANPFELHVLLLDVAIASWRPYLITLHDTIANLSEKAYIMKIGDGDSLAKMYTVEVQDYQTLKDIEDRASDVLLCLDSTQDTVTTIKSMYEQHLNKLDHHSTKHPSESDEILSALADKEKDIAYSRKKVKSLLLKAHNTRALITSLLERLNGYNLEKQMFALQSLQQQAQDENAILRGLAEQGSRDSTSVKILTLLMLVYLPCTVVSGFYSTQFVDQDVSSAGNKQLKYADNVWIFFAVSIPLTLGTVMVWIVWANSKMVGRKLSEMQQERREKMREYVRSFGIFGKGSGLPI